MALWRALRAEGGAQERLDSLKSRLMAWQPGDLLRASPFLLQILPQTVEKDAARQGSQRPTVV